MAESIRVKRERISPVIWIQMKSNLNVKVHRIKNNCLALVRAKLDCCCGTNIHTNFKISTTHSTRNSKAARTSQTKLSQKLQLALVSNQCKNEYLFWSELNIKYYLPYPNCPNQITNIICAVKYIQIVFK